MATDAAGTGEAAAAAAQRTLHGGNTGKYRLERRKAYSRGTEIQSRRAKDKMATHELQNKTTALIPY